MSRVESTGIRIARTREEVFTFLSVPENYKVLMPERVKSFESTAEGAKIEIAGLGKIELRITIKNHPEYIEMKPFGKVPFEFRIEWHILQVSDGVSEVKAVVEAKLNMFMKPLVLPALENLIDGQVQRLKEQMEGR